jgi:hypothetical protein
MFVRDDDGPAHGAGVFFNRGRIPETAIA